MEQTVYIDLFFIINFSMDFLCFFITAKLMSCEFKIGRSLAASGVGGVYACVSLLLSGGMWTLALDLLAALLMCAIAVGGVGRFKETVGYTVVYAACSIVLGGFMTAAFSLFNKLRLDEILGGEEESGDGISVWLFALLALVSGLISLFGIKFFKKKSTRIYGEAEIVYRGRAIVLKAMCDSGNMLTDPISSKACVVVDRGAVESILPDGLHRMIRDGRTEGLSGKDLERVRVIPAHTALGGGMLYALRVDELKLNFGKGWRRAEALVALCELGEHAQGVRALVPSALAMGAP